MTQEQQILTDEKMQGITGQIVIGQTVLVAYKLGFFALFSEQKKLPPHEIANKMRLSSRSVQALISCAGAMDLIEGDDNGYSLSNIGEQYLDKNSPLFYGDVLDLLIDQRNLMSFDAIEQAILQNQAAVDSGIDIFSSESNLGSTKNFVKSLHSKALAPALFWTKKIDLEKYRQFIDLGGGSGVHAISACKRNPSLRATVCDREAVLHYTKEYIERDNLSSRIDTLSLDMWRVCIPSGDVVFLGDIFHDWPKGKCIVLAKKCYQSLKEGGMIILHEMLMNSQKTGPSLSAAYNMKMMLWTEGNQYSANEFLSILKEAGFKNIRILPGLGNWSLVIGHKASS